jgi:hypothetical protein
LRQKGAACVARVVVPELFVSNWVGFDWEMGTVSSYFHPGACGGPGKFKLDVVFVAAGIVLPLSNETGCRGLRGKSKIGGGGGYGERRVWSESVRSHEPWWRVARTALTEPANANFRGGRTVGIENVADFERI